MAKYQKNDEIKTFKELESPNLDKSFEERTGEEFTGEVNYEFIPDGNGYGTLEPK